MIRRVTKITSLLVVAASIVAMVPVIAEAQEGTINNAVASGNGKFIVDGEINGEDDAFYYVSDCKYTKLDYAESGDTIGNTYYGKYVEMIGNNGDYYIDLTTGKETDEFSVDVYNDEIARNLRKKIKKDNDGRFLEDSYDNNDVNADFNIPGPTGIWSQYSYKLKQSNIIGSQNSTIYCDDKGNYVDADYNLGKVPVYTTTGSSVNIKNTEDTYETKEKDGYTYEIKAQIQNDATIVEDFNDITRTAKLSIWGRRKGLNETYKNITSQVEFGTSSNHHAFSVDTDSNYGDYVTVFQNISKAQSSDNIDGIRYAKDVKTYFLTDEDGNAQQIFGLGTSDKSGMPYLMGIGDSKGVESYVIDKSDNKIYAEAITFKSKGGYNYIDIGKSDETDYDSMTLGAGQLYCLDNGYIKWWNNDDSFEKIYRADGGMSNMSVGDKNNIIIWNKDKGYFSIISPKTSSEEKKDSTINTSTSTTTGAAVTTTGWIKNNEGNWFYIKADGTKASGWINDNGDWYYFKDNGTMSTGWINDNGIWYYFDASGAMLVNTTIDGYVLGEDGAWIE